jgi:hypothetical protein
VLPTIDKVLRRAALVLFALFVLTSLPVAAWRALGRLGFALSRAPESVPQARLRILGPEVTAAYDALRRAIPRDGEYLLIDGGTPDQGNPLWVRFELAPRKARWLGAWSALPSSEELRRRWPATARYAVIALPERQPPVLLSQEELLSALERARAAR